MTDLYASVDWCSHYNEYRIGPLDGSTGALTPKPNNNENTMNPPTNSRRPLMKMSVFIDADYPNPDDVTSPSTTLPYSAIRRFHGQLGSFMERRFSVIHILALVPQERELLESIGTEHDYSGRISVHQVDDVSDTFPLDQSIGKLAIGNPRPPEIKTIAVQNAVAASDLVVLFPSTPMNVSDVLRSSNPSSVTSLALIQAKARRRATLVINPTDQPPVLLFTDRIETAIRTSASQFGAGRFRR